MSVFLAVALGLIFLRLDHSYGALQSRQVDYLLLPITIMAKSSQLHDRKCFNSTNVYLLVIKQNEQIGTE